VLLIHHPSRLAGGIWRPLMATEAKAYQPSLTLSPIT